MPKTKTNWEVGLREHPQRVIIIEADGFFIEDSSLHLSLAGEKVLVVSATRWDYIRRLGDQAVGE